MSIFNRFKKLFKEKEKEEPEQIEELKFSDIKSWIQNKKEEIEKREEETFDSVKTKIDEFEESINEKIEILQNATIDEKKAKDRFKSVSEEGRGKYIEAVKRLIYDLNNLKKSNLESMTKEIDEIFSDFNKKSYKSYERATLLIGKETANVKEETKKLSRELIKIFENNKDIKTLSKKISDIESKLNELGNISENSKTTESEISNLKKSLKEKEEKTEEIKGKKEEIKNNPEYISELKNLEELKNNKEELQREIINLKSNIDFKKLGNFYHIFEDKMPIVKSYKENFEENFKKDLGTEFSELLKKANMNTEDISKKIEEINQKNEKIKEKESQKSPNKNKIKSLEHHEKSLNEEIENIKNQLYKKEKKIEKTKPEREALIKEIIEKMENMNLKIISQD